MTPPPVTSEQEIFPDPCDKPLCVVVWRLNSWLPDGAGGIPNDPQRLTARCRGPDKPVATNATREGREANRRVELRRLWPEPPDDLAT